MLDKSLRHDLPPFNEGEEIDHSYMNQETGSSHLCLFMSESIVESGPEVIHFFMLILVELEIHLVVTCWERADLLALVCDVTFPIGILGQV